MAIPLLSCPVSQSRCFWGRAMLIFFFTRLFSIALVSRHTSHLYPGGHRLCEVQLAGRQPASGEGPLTCICKKLTQGRERTVGMAECPRPLGEGGSKGRHGCVGQECGPADNKHSDQAGPERLGSREGAHKGGCLVTPPAPDLDGQDNQAAALRAEQLRQTACKGKGGALNRPPRQQGCPEPDKGDTNVVSTASCCPPHNGKPLASAKRVLRVTTRAAARSRGHPRLRRTPARAQAARWSPRESKGRRHRQ